MLAVVLMVMLSLPLLLVLVIFDFRKENSKGPRRIVCAATAKSLGASSRSSQKMSDGKCKWLLLLLSLKTQDR